MEAGGGATHTREIDLAASRRVLVLALDAASPDLIRRWTADHTLPNLAHLIGTGLSGPTRSVEGLYVGATWPSFYTGNDPARHGIYWADRLRLGTYRVQRCSQADLGRLDALWEILSEAGRRVVVLDVPLTRRSPRLNGVQVVEWGVHDAMFGFQTTPRRLAREILDRYGPHPAPAGCDAPRRTLSEYRAFADALARGAALRARLTNDLLAREDWDFAIQVFSESHCAGHQLWHFHDTGHPAFHAEATRAAGDLVRQVYVAIDAAIGEIVRRFETGTAVVVLALHGMAHSCGASLLLPDILERLGVVHSGSHEVAARRSRPTDAASAGAPRTGERVEPAAAPAAPTPASAGARGLSRRRGTARRLAALYRRLPEPIRAPLYRARQQLNQSLLRRGTPIALDPDRTRAFHIGLGTGAPFSGVRLNLRGREPAGALAAGPEADAFIEGLTRDLLAIVDPETGSPLVRRVLRTADLFQGPRLAELPDLLVEWHTEPPRGTSVAGRGAGAAWRALSNGTGSIEKVNDYCRTGEHRIEGMFIARGQGIAHGRFERVVSILDLAPTLAALLGVAAPTMPGRRVAEMLGAVAGPT